MTGLMDTILEKVGLSYDELSELEKQTLYTWVEQVKTNQLTVEGIRLHVSAMRETLEKELIDEPEFNYIFIFKVPNRKQILLKARLKNMLMIESLLMGPERAQKALEAAIGNLNLKNGATNAM